MGSKVKFGTLCIRTCEHNTDYNFSPITFKIHMQVVDDERRNPIDFGFGGQRSRPTLEPYRLSLIRFKLHMYMDDETTVLAKSLPKFTCNLWKLRRGTLSILGHREEGQGQLWHSACGTLWAQYRLVFTQLLSNFTCKLIMRRGTLLILNHRVKGQGQLWNSACETLWA